MDLSKEQVYNITQCEEAAATVSSPLYLIPSIFHTLATAGTYYMLWKICCSYTSWRAYHVNTKVLMFVHMGSIVLFSTATLINYMSLFLNAIMAKEDCDYLYQTSSCSFLRRIFFFSNLLGSFMRISIMGERAYAIYQFGTYEHMQSKFGYYVSSTFAVLSLVIVSWVTWMEDSSELLTNCYAFSSCPSIRHRVYEMFRFQLLLEFVTLGICLYVCKCNRTIRKRYECIDGSSELSVNHNDNGWLSPRYTTHESRKILGNLFPIIICSSVIMSVYICFSHLGHLLLPIMTLAHYKQLASWIFLIPYNAFFSMFLYDFVFQCDRAQKLVRLENAMKEKFPTERFQDIISKFWDNHYDKTYPDRASSRSGQSTLRSPRYQTTKL
ncbi:Protein CBR-SRA-37 [Caenorhabditis briggsae]|uniref:Protein CBR-SRA-37 n=2 Tax=Caenorhabditis briggsae TaxID=6238 RepID=A8X4Y4_CAEBR|nr:Protein CBR-SRA-37 [Caenorhabditis briggsae]ULT84924.1 hypothetical protein L3Y34_013537 [Caenorhabditis briggsae]CAP27694.1 Protein CBR-SRA-37 [Caenorhabditis briggsae]